MNIIDELETRGLLDKCSNDENVRKMMETKQTIYCGFDPSAPSMQLGNFVMITMLRRLQLAGHKIIAVLGGGTGMIGDPSGKKSERSFLTPEQVNENIERFKLQFSKYIDTSTPDKGEIVNNADWWSKINVISYLRDYGKLFQINYMLDKDIVRSRLTTGISYAEFSYMLLQSGDFLHLYNEKDCHLQIGGGDQWGNLTAALDFVRKSLGSKAEAEVFSLKLITDSMGRKFGKSENGALYLDPTMTSPYQLYQYFINLDDDSIEKFLMIFDYRPIDEIKKVVEEHNNSRGSRLGQRELARVIVTNVHSQEKADECLKMSQALFTDQYQGLGSEALAELASSLKTIPLEGEISLQEGLLTSGLASSKREVREFLSAGSVRVNGEVVKDAEYILSPSIALQNKFIFLKRGKKNFAVLNFGESN